MKPDWTEASSQAALYLHKPARVIVAYAALLQDERRVSQSPEFSVAVQEPIVFLGFLAFPNTLFTVRMVGIIMVLVHGAHHRGRVHDRNTRIQSVPKEPRIPPWTPDDKPGDFFVVQAFVEDEIVDPRRRSLASRVKGTLSERLLPIRSLEIQGFTNVCVPSAPRHQKAIENLRE